MVTVLTWGWGEASAEQLWITTYNGVLTTVSCENDVLTHQVKHSDPCTRSSSLKALHQYPTTPLEGIARILEVQELCALRSPLLNACWLGAHGVLGPMCAHGRGMLTPLLPPDEEGWPGYFSPC